MLCQTIELAKTRKMSALIRIPQNKLFSNVLTHLRTLMSSGRK